MEMMPDFIQLVPKQHALVFSQGKFTQILLMVKSKIVFASDTLLFFILLLTVLYCRSILLRYNRLMASIKGCCEPLLNYLRYDPVVPKTDPILVYARYSIKSEEKQDG
ncbi:MAG: hypothetical protein P8Z33_00935 [Gammaproteobacteria bacterium]|jgi:hypothetical protein